MLRARLFRGLLGGAAAIILATSVPVVAAPLTHTSGTCTPGSRSCPIRLDFATGAYTAQAGSQLPGVHARRWFVVHTEATQSMVLVVAGAGPTRGTVSFPNGTTSGQPGGRIYDGLVPATGDDLILVTESQMAQGWSGRVDVVALVY